MGRYSSYTYQTTYFCDLHNFCVAARGICNDFETNIPQEWLDKLERLRKAATPGPWSKSEQGTNETYHHRIERYYGGKEVPEHIAYVFLPNVFGKLHDAAYIVAACNAVPRLIEMVQDMSSVIAGMPGMESTPDEILQDFFEATEPEE